MQLTAQMESEVLGELNSPDPRAGLESACLLLLIYERCDERSGFAETSEEQLAAELRARSDELMLRLYDMKKRHEGLVA